MTKAMTWALALAALAASGAAAKTVEADKIWVQKSERKLHLMKGREIVRTFPIHLGRQPLGHKRREGDSRTPEGLYSVRSRNSVSEYYRALEISYPNHADRLRAAVEGVNPGGKIMIHGEPDDPLARLTLPKDWTQGCIALKNRDMRVVWKAAGRGTPVQIDP
ncbi:MAG: L,D-transpeptidase family protein [Gammaproteobacteria bacterium]|nr:L,D-transpeptidase family protein [Gammaproteobacteria bacterium]